MISVILISAAVVAVLLLLWVYAAKNGLVKTFFEPPERKAGRRGEEQATAVIRYCLRAGDYLYTNVEKSYDGQRAEFDNIIINQYGVFIIEVKNYVGQLSGQEDDYEWEKTKVTDAGNLYTKLVRNPIRQVKRQIYILSKYLCYYGVETYVKGYVLLLEGNSPVESEYVLSSIHAIDCVLHTKGYKTLSAGTLETIKELLN